MSTYSATKITDNIYWVGAVDWDLRDFHGYLTDRGTTYNAFLIIDEKVTLIDTVKAPFKRELVQRIESVIELEKIDYIVSLHSEMDHSGCIPDMIDLCKPEKVFASKAGVDALENHFCIGDKLTAVENNEVINIGERNLKMILTKMLHWPDSMVTHLDKEKILFTQDAFGMHYASDERYHDELPPDIVRYQAAKYFGNILTPFMKLIIKAVDSLTSSGLEFDMIAPDHGPIWRGDGPQFILDKYVHWSKQLPTNKAVVVYHTMWHSTERMAHAICEGLHQGGMRPKLMGLSTNHRSDIATEVLEAGALLVGSPTMNNQYVPLVADSMIYLKGLCPKNLVGGIFGSYGWSPLGTKRLAEDFEAMGIECPNPPMDVKYVPTEDDLIACKEYGLAIAKTVMEKLNSQEG